MSEPTVCGVQFDPAWENPEANRARARALLDRQPPAAGSLVVLPEMFTSGFSMNTADIAEPAGGPTETWLADTARHLGVTLVGGWARRGPDGRPANEAVVAGPDGARLAVYRKQRSFTPGGEAAHYTAGTHGVTFPWASLNVALFVCYDLRFPELFRAVAARSRPELFVVIASWPAKRTAHWLALLRARAIENQAYVLGVNRVGDDPTHHHEGRSVVVDYFGEIVADAGSVEGLVTARLDVEPLREYRRKLPFLDDLIPNAEAAA